MSKGYSIFGLLFLVGCASLEKDCASCKAESYGADWIIVQYNAQGPANCWNERGTSVSNEVQSDGIWWQSSSGHLIHISGWYARVQVNGGNFDTAAKSLGVDLARCKGGKYEAP